MSSTEHHATTKTEDAKPGFKPVDEEVFETKRGSDLSKVALFVALLAIVSIVVLYFSQQQTITGLEQNIAGLTGKVDEVQGVKQEVAAVKGQVAILYAEVAAIRYLPKEARKIFISGMLSESASKVEYIITQVENEEQRAKLAEIQKMLKDVAAGL